MEMRAPTSLLDPSDPSSLAWLHRTAKSIVYRGVSYEDVVTDVLLKTKCQPMSKAYYGRLLTTTAIDHWRKEQRRMHLPIEAALSLADPKATSQEEAIYDRHIIGQAEALMSPEEAHFLERVADGDTTLKIANDHGFTRGRVKSRVFRFRARARRAVLGGDDGY